MKKKWKQHKEMSWIMLFVFVLICSNSFAQGVPAEHDETGLSLATLEKMPLQVIEQANGEVFLQRSKNDVERIIGYAADREKEFDEDEQSWIGYLEKPHPSVETMQRYFVEAAKEFDVPVELLQAIGQVESNWTQMGPSIDQGWGVMHLVQNMYANTLEEAASLLGVAQQTLKDDARQNIRGAAALLAHYAGQKRENFTSLEDWFVAVKRFSALDGDELQTMQAKRYFEVVRDGTQAPTLWNEQISLQAHPNVSLQAFPKAVEKHFVASSDYSPAKSYYYSSCTYTRGRSRKIDTWVNHWIGYGTYAGAISYLSRCDIKASAHFVIKQNGEITQTVRVKDTAWHAGARGYPNNSRSIGIEHEAVVTNPSTWNSTSMLKASAKMARYFADKYGIPKKRALPGMRGHNEMPGTSTQCPGNLPWNTWMNYLNGSSPAAPKLTSGLSIYTNNPNSHPIEYGQWMEGSFKVKNYGGKTITFQRIGVGGRAPSSNGGSPNSRVVCDLGWQTNVTLRPNEEKYIRVSSNSYGCNNTWGTYQLSAYYQLSSGSWYKIPTGVPGTRTDRNFQIVKHAAPVRLSNGIGKTDYVPRKGYDHFYLDIPEHTTKLTITTTQTKNGNYLNLYEKTGSGYPTTGSYTHRSIGSSSNETIMINNPVPGRHTILVDGYYSGGSEKGTPYKITAKWENPTTPTHKSFTLLSRAGLYIEELGRTSVQAWVSPYWNKDLLSSGAKWIWSSYYTTTSENQHGATRTFREAFTIPDSAKNIKGTIKISADDRFIIKLNGAKIAENGDHRYVRTYTFSPKTGQNVLKISGINTFNGSLEPTRNAAGVIYYADISYELLHSLTVKKTGAGSGTVTGIGINCGTDCSENYGDKALITLVAKPESGSTFSGWSGVCNGIDECTLTMDSAKTVTATFGTTTHTILSSEGPGGNISPEGSVVLKNGESQTFTITPDAGYEIATLLVDGRPVTPQSSYTFDTVTQDHTIRAYFKLTSHKITANAQSGGTISPSGIVSVIHGANQTFTITPETGYRIVNVLVDGSPIGTVPTYTFTNITSDRSINAIFEEIPVDAVSLTIDDSRAKPGETNVPVVIALDNEKTEVGSIQFRIKYDAEKGIHAVGGSSGAKLSDRTKDFDISVIVTENGSDSEALILLYNISGKKIEAGTGVILELLFNVDASAQPGAKSLLTFSESVVADSSGGEIPSDKSDTGIITIEEPYELGDINADGSVNVLDLQLLINCITSGSPCERGDMNEDGLYNVLDVQLLINKINQTTGVVPSPTGEHSMPGVTGINMLQLPDLRFQPDSSGTFGIGLVNDTEIAAGQLTLMYDSTTGFDLTGIELTDRTRGFYQPVVFEKDDSNPANVKIQVLFFSLDGATIKPGSGDILEFMYQTSPDADGTLNMAIVDALLTDENGHSQTVTPQNGDTQVSDLMQYSLVAIAGIGGQISPEGSLNVDAGAEQTFSIQSDDGYTIEKVIVDGLSEGAITSYTLTNISADHTIEVIFTSDSETLSSYFGFEEFGGNWNDAEKSWENPDDDWMCWAMAASNILDWTGWSRPFFDSAQDTFATFQNYWTNAGGLMEYGWHWWFDGTEAPSWDGWSELNDGWAGTESGGNYWSNYNFFDYFYEDWAEYTDGLWSAGTGLMSVVDDYLHSGYGTTMAVYSQDGGHALSVWGYEYDEYGQYTGVWVTDSDDYLTDLKLLSVVLDTTTNLWYLDEQNQYNYKGWFIGGVQALEQRTTDPVPEPGTMLLLSLGLLGILAMRRKQYHASRR